MLRKFFRPTLIGGQPTIGLIGPPGEGFRVTHLSLTYGMEKIVTHGQRHLKPLRSRWKK